MEHLFRLQTDDLSVIEKKFYRYPFEREIAIRKQELAIRPTDNNFDGGKGNLPSSPTENKIVKEQSDPFILERQKWARVIGDIYRDASELEKKVMNIKYFGDRQYLSWTAVAEEVHYSKSKIYEVRYAILERFARKVGEL